MSKKRVRGLTEDEIDAVDKFVHRFVVENKRARARKFLLGNSEQRIEAIQRLADWLDTAVVIAAPRARELKAKFGPLSGRLFDHASVSRITMDDAQAFANGGFGAVFISDDGTTALLIPEVGEAVLCVRARE